MNYSAEEFMRLIEAVEEQGGTLLPDVCVPQTFAYTKPPYAKNDVAKKATSGCYNETRFAIPYDPEPRSKENTGVITVCACCDEIVLWPRFVNEGIFDE